MDRLRGMAILMVLLYHSIIVFPVDLHEIQWCRTLHTFLWTVQMPLFFLVSGFCYSFRGNYAEYAARKCRRILIPHIVFSLLDILPRLIPNPLVHEQMEVGEAVADFIFYGGSDWFLWTLFVISAVFPALEKLLCGGARRRSAGVLLTVALFIAKPYATDFLLLNMACQYLLYFLIGYGLRRKADAFMPVVSRKRNILPGACLTATAFACFQAFGKTGDFELPGILLETVCVFCSFVFFFGTAAFCKGVTASLLSLCGKWSLQMYLLDAYALVASRTLLVSILGIRVPAVIIAGNFLLDTAAVLFVSRYILTKTKVFRLCCGIPENG